MTELTIPEDVSDFGQAFAGCYTISSVRIHGNVNVIKENAFSYCTNLSVVSIDEGVTEIEGYAFRECSKITKFSIPNTMMTIDPYIFYHNSDNGLPSRNIGGTSYNGGYYL